VSCSCLGLAWGGGTVVAGGFRGTAPRSQQMLITFLGEGPPALNPGSRHLHLPQLSAPSLPGPWRHAPCFFSLGAQNSCCSRWLMHLAQPSSTHCQSFRLPNPEAVGSLGEIRSHSLPTYQPLPSPKSCCQVSICS
jgi:hypothetical protein